MNLDSVESVSIATGAHGRKRLLAAELVDRGVRRGCPLRAEDVGHLLTAGDPSWNAPVSRRRFLSLTGSAGAAVLVRLPAPASRASVNGHPVATRTTGRLVQVAAPAGRRNSSATGRARAMPDGSVWLPERSVPYSSPLDGRR